MNTKTKKYLATFDAITNASEEILKNGAVFHPFRVKSTTNMEEVYSNANPKAILKLLRSKFAYSWGITFYKVVGEGDFLPLGDFAILHGDPDPQQYGSLLFAPTENSDALAHPIGFQWILDDHGSGNNRSISYLKPIPPKGYEAVGLCFGVGTPDVNDYWCVKREYLKEVKNEVFWSDKGYNWESHNGNLLNPSFGKPNPIKASEGQMLLLPPTFSNPEAGLTSWALNVKPAFLEIDRVEAGDYHKLLKATEGSETSYGVNKIAIIPNMAIGDDLYQKAKNSPFYFIADETFWLCIFARSTENGGNFEQSITLGTKEAESKEFSKHTSLTISSEVGAEYSGISAKISASYTQEFGMQTTHSKEKTKEANTTIELNFEKKSKTWAWQNFNYFTLYRIDGTRVSEVSFGKNDVELSTTED